MQTLLGAKLHAAGMRSELVQFDLAIAKCLNAGGTIDEMRARLEIAAEKLRSADHARSVQTDPSPTVSAPQSGLQGTDRVGLADSGPIENVCALQSELLEGGQRTYADDGQGSFADQQSEAGGDDHSRLVDDDPETSVIPAREPSAAEVAGRLEARQRLSVFDRERTYSGRMWGNVAYRNLDDLTEDGDLAREIKIYIGHLSGDDRHKLIRELMTPRQFAQLLNKVRRHAA